MTIARRLILLLTVPVLILIGLGIFVGVQLNRIEVRNRFVTETQIGSLEALGKISRSFTELRVNVRSYLLVADKAEQTRARALFDADKAELARLLVKYADEFISDDMDRRMLSDFRELSREYIVGAEKIMSMADAGQREAAIAELIGPLADIGARLGKASDAWIQHNGSLSAEAGQATTGAVDDAQRGLLVAVGFAVAVCGVFGLLTFRSIVHPIRSLEKTVKSVADGNYAMAVPFTRRRTKPGHSPDRSTSSNRGRRRWRSSVG